MIPSLVTLNVEVWFDPEPRDVKRGGKVTEVGVEILIFYFCSVFVQSSRKDFQWNTFILKVVMNFHYERKLDDPWVDLLFLISYNDCIVLYSVTVVQ